MRTGLATVVCLLIAVCAAAADEKPAEQAPPKPLTAEQAADAVLKAVEANDQAALEALAERDEPDPWLVADELCYRDEHDAAAAFAKAAPRVDVDKLPAYVAAWREREPDGAERELLATMNAAMREEAPTRVVHGTAALTADLTTIVRIRLWQVRGVALWMVRRLEASKVSLQRAAEAARALGWLRRAAGLFVKAGVAAMDEGAWGEALALWREALAIAELRHDGNAAARILNDIATIHARRGNYARALATWEQVLARMEAMGDAASAGTTLTNMGIVYSRRGDYDAALTLHERALVLLQTARDQTGAARALHNLGGVHFRRGDYDRALAAYERALERQRALGEAASAALILSHIGDVFAIRGEFARALAVYERALADHRALGNKAGIAGTLSTMSIAYEGLGRYARALDIGRQALAQQRVMGDRPGAAATLANLGGMHLRLGEHAKALAMLEQAVAEQRAMSESAGAALNLANVGCVRMLLGDQDEALVALRAALDEQQRLEDRRGTAGTLSTIALILGEQGDLRGALSNLERARGEQEALGLREDAARTGGHIGAVYRRMGRLPEARRALAQSVRRARHLRAVPVLVDALTELARVHLDAGQAGRALAAAQQALREVETLLGGLSEEEGALARQRQSPLFETGVLAAAREEDVAEMVTFLEQGRAGALLDVLGKRETLRWKAEFLPGDLLQADRAAQAAQRVARYAYDHAFQQGDRQAVRQAGRELDDATEVVREMAGRIQREMKAQAGLFYPRAETIENIESTLERDQALVLYGLCLDEALALVLRQDGERIVSLGKVADVEAACEALDATDPSADPMKALARLRMLLVEPLNLGEDVTQVLVSPEGSLCYLPFGALFEQTVTMTPSGTTHVLLLDEERDPGRGILSLGNPDYSGISEGAKAIYFRGRRLSSLPATGQEVEAIGTTTLLGADASEAGLREAVSKAKRWKAVHFACHGLIDVERPMLSSLALSRAGEDDGFLTALEVLRMHIPADLAVLSACETGKGKVIKGEGIVGLTRAFMFAGAPRVICSLWKVDDEATQALMIKFYELWNPKEGKGLGAAAALKKAQEYVRTYEPPNAGESRERGPLRRESTPDESGRGNRPWEHPYYWAAWVLWGLPD